MTKIPDEIGSYLKMIGRVPMLKDAEEIELGQQVKRMMMCLEVKEKLEENCSEITNEQWAAHLEITKTELEQILRIGKRAKDKMVKANLRLVVAIAKKYQGHGVELLDLVQEGTVGLMRAVEKFEVKKGYKFSSYAYHWVRQAMTRAIGNQSRTIRLPLHVDSILFNVRKKMAEFRQKFGRLPTISELSKALDMPPEKIRFFQEISSPMLSLEQPSFQDSELTLGSLIIDPNSEFTKVWENLANQELVEKLFLNLTPVEQKVIIESYLSSPPLSLSKVGKILNVSRETVRLIKKKALQKLSDSLSNYRDIPSESLTVNSTQTSVKNEERTLSNKDNYSELEKSPLPKTSKKQLTIRQTKSKIFNMNITPNKTIVQLIREPETVIEVGKKLLNSEDCSEVMAALVLMTGLKCELLLTATTLDLKTAYSVVFTDPTSSEEVSREIPTLTLAENVIKAINFIRNTIDTNHLDSRTINASFLPSVINACDRYFKKLIPNSSKKDSRYTQIHRAVYGTMATYWYCPPDVSPIDYKAYICGQEKIMEGKGDTMKEKIAVQLHYYEYQIGVNRKNIDERVGIKLDNPLVKIIEKFQPLDRLNSAEDSNVLELTTQLSSEKDEITDPKELMVLQLKSSETSEVLEGLKQATGCTPEQLLLGNIYEVISKEGEVQLVLKEGKVKQTLPNFVEGETIIKAISKLRKAGASSFLHQSIMDNGYSPSQPTPNPTHPRPLLGGEVGSRK